MSTPLTLDEQLAAALADAKAAQELASDAQAQLTAKDAELATSKAEAATNLGLLNAAIEDGNKAKAELETANAATLAETEKAANATVELDKLKAAVASNPAFADAAAGRKPVAAGSHEASRASMSRAEFDKLSPEAKDRFIAGRGTITA